MYLVDANIFLEMLLAQARADECRRFLDEFKEYENALYVSTFTIHSIAVHLIRNNKLKELSEFLSDLISGEITRFDTNTEDELKVLKLVEEFDIDFDDAIQLYLCQKNNLKIISYDKHFDETPIERIEPRDLF